MNISKNIFEIIYGARQGAATMTKELVEWAQQHPVVTRKLLSTMTSTFNTWFTSPVYRKFLDFFQLWHYRNEQHYFEVDEFGMDEAVLELVRPFFQFLFFNYFRIDVEGEENISIDGPAVLIANHSGGLAYDGVMTNLAVYNTHPKNRYVRFLVDDFVYYLPFVGTFIQRTGGIRACHENAMRLLDHGHMILVFPEGIKGISKLFEHRYQLQRFGRGGYVRLAMRTGVPIIPTAIIGAEEIHPLIWKSDKLGKMLGMPYFPFTPTFPWLGPLGGLPLPTKWRVIFGKPMQFSRYGPKDAEDEKLVAKVSSTVRSNIQKMVDDALDKRESIWY
jgi:1-acyl-sn-glycerol-3-phosphate acyltransferase